MRRRSIYQWLFTAIIFTSGTLISIYTYQGLKNSDTARRLAELQKETYEQSVRASLLFTRAPQVLNSFSALFNSSDFVSREEFERYSSYLIKNEKEIAAIMWTPYVVADERKQYETRLFMETGQDRGFIDIHYPDHRVISAPIRDFYFPILYVVPKDLGSQLVGIDINGRPQNRVLRREAMQSGLVFTTPTFSELTDPHGASMIAIYHPVHVASQKNGKQQDKFSGFLIMLMTPEVLMRSEFGQENQSRFFMRLIDKDDHNRQLASNRQDKNSEPPSNIFRYDLSMPGRHWSLELYSRAPTNNDNTALFLFLCMLTLTLVTSISFYRSTNNLFRLKIKNINLELQRRDLKQKANFDSLTGLHNRRYFQDKIELLLKQPNREYEMALCLLDLDNFKQINDLFGHNQGDLLLKSVADGLVQETRLGDQVARLGGDEFALALPLTHGPEEIRVVLDRLLSLIPRIGDELSGHRVHISASIGITISSPEIYDYEQLMHQADLAMYASKKRGKHTYTFFAPDLS
jgi:diguanylate cyclase (GGDEF)-like protein